MSPFQGFRFGPPRKLLLKQHGIGPFERKAQPYARSRRLGPHGYAFRAADSRDRTIELEIDHERTDGLICVIGQQQDLSAAAGQQTGLDHQGIE